MPIIEYSQRSSFLSSEVQTERAVPATVGAEYKGGIFKGRSLVITGHNTIDYVYPKCYPADRLTLVEEDINRMGQILVPAIVRVRFGLSPAPGFVVDRTDLLWTPEDLSDVEPPQVLQLARLALEANRNLED